MLYIGRKSYQTSDKLNWISFWLVYLLGHVGLVGYCTLPWLGIWVCGHRSHYCHWDTGEWCRKWWGHVTLSLLGCMGRGVRDLGYRSPTSITSITSIWWVLEYHKHHPPSCYHGKAYCTDFCNKARAVPYAPGLKDSNAPFWANNGAVDSASSNSSRNNTK
jgi:hypothetical protein